MGPTFVQPSPEPREGHLRLVEVNTDGQRSGCARPLCQQVPDRTWSRSPSLTALRPVTPLPSKSSGGERTRLSAAGVRGGQSRPHTTKEPSRGWVTGGTPEVAEPDRPSQAPASWQTCLTVSSCRPLRDSVSPGPDSSLHHGSTSQTWAEVESCYN